MDSHLIMRSITQRQHLFIWFASGMLMVIAVLHITLTLTTSINVPKPLPPSPETVVPGGRVVKFEITLFNESNAWSPFSVGELLPHDTRLRDAPRSKLPLKVVGIVLRGSAKESLAIMSNGKQQFTIGVNETLPGTLASVAYMFVDRVILQHRGSYESIIWESESH